MLLLCNETNIRKIRSEVPQPASAGNGAELVNCKLITRIAESELESQRVGFPRTVEVEFFIRFQMSN